MILGKILSQRQYSKTPSWNIVYEWEDIISKTLGLRLIKESKLVRKYIVNTIDQLGLSDMCNYLLPKNDLFLWFCSISKLEKSIKLSKNCIPVIIDFWLEDKDILTFFEVYKNVPLILVTNYEVFDLLKLKKCPIPFEHWGLSYPDYYALETKPYQKEFDVCLFGRNNPFFVKMLDKYSELHPGFTYIKNQGVSSNRCYYTNKGDFICKDSGRESYLNMIRKTKVSCYSTPGIDESKQGANGFNQVTPRVFEMLCNQCQVIGYYPMSSDVKWYNLNSVVPNVNNYSEFETLLDEMLIKKFDHKRVEEFMQKHYTSSRVNDLIEILTKYNIIIK